MSKQVSSLGGRYRDCNTTSDWTPPTRYNFDAKPMLKDWFFWLHVIAVPVLIWMVGSIEGVW